MILQPVLCLSDLELVHIHHAWPCYEYPRHDAPGIYLSPRSKTPVILVLYARLALMRLIHRPRAAQCRPISHRPAHLHHRWNQYNDRYLLVVHPVHPVHPIPTRGSARISTYEDAELSDQDRWANITRITDLRLFVSSFNWQDQSCRLAYIQ